jgi:hypothetical protein
VADLRYLAIRVCVEIGIERDCQFTSHIAEADKGDRLPVKSTISPERDAVSSGEKPLAFIHPLHPNPNIQWMCSNK